MADLAIPYSFRGLNGHVQVGVSPNTDPRRLGCHLLDESLPPEAARGYPVCVARPDIDLEGYSAACGWIQVVRSTDGSGAFETDPLALFCDVDTPFAFFGISPVLFDAPFRAERYDMVWQARAFLAALPDGVMSKKVYPLAAFGWGFTITGESMEVDGPSPLGLQVWDEHVPLFQSTYPRWTFLTRQADAEGDR